MPMGISKNSLACAGVAAMIGSLRVFAADTAAPSNELETITVTAEKRSESEQTVPLSMTTFSAVALQEKQINTFFDYATKVPNLAFAPTGDGVGTARTVSIRGISGDGVTGFYIDDTPLPDSLEPRVLDIDHIEVLRGPQGTLYGARSMGGLVRIVTKAPNLSTFDGSVHAGLSHTERTSQPNWTADGVFNMPIIQDRVALRLSFFGDDQAGYFKRTFCTDPAAAMAVTCTPLAATGVATVNNVGENYTYGGAAALTVKINDALTITPRILQQRSDYNGFPLADYRSIPGNGIGYPVPSGPVTLPRPLYPSSFTQARWFNVPEGGYDAWALYSIAVNWKTGFGELVSSTAYFTRKVAETEDESDFVYAGITSGIPGGSPQPGGIQEIKDYQRFVEEVRFASDLKGPIQFVVGGFYSDFHGRLPLAAYYPGATVPGFDATLLGPGGGEITPGYPNLIFASDFHTDIKEPAAFGEVSFQPIDALKVTAGLRWYQVKDSASGYEEGAATGGGPAIVSPPVTTTESGTNPKFEAD